MKFLVWPSVILNPELLDFMGKSQEKGLRSFDESGQSSEAHNSS